MRLTVGWTSPEPFSYSAIATLTCNIEVLNVFARSQFRIQRAGWFIINVRPHENNGINPSLRGCPLSRLDMTC